MEFGDPELTRRFVLESLLFQCVQRPRPARVHAVLAWCFEAAHEGVALPPAGVVADVGHLVFGEVPPDEPEPDEAKPPGPEYLPTTLVRQYEDLVLGKLYGDRSFDRAADALRRYSSAKDRAVGLAFLLRHVAERAGFGGVHLNPAAIRNLERYEGTDLLAKASESLAEHGPILMEELPEGPALDSETEPVTLMEFLYQDLIRTMRSVGDVLGVEDIFELEHGTAIAGFGQRIALRQVLRASEELSIGIPRQPVRPIHRKQQVVTQIQDEDIYPIGGFSSISNRGSIESLLHSQLAYMEQDERPDMFDIKFLRDELLYYSRDENQFLRRRRSFVFALFPDLSEAKETDESPYQRIILLLALLRVAVERLIDWLSEESLRFEFVFLNADRKSLPKQAPLANERELLEILFREQIANGTVGIVESETWPEFQNRCDRHARRSLANAGILSKSQLKREVENTLLTQIRLDQPVPGISIDENDWQSEEPHRTQAWSATLIKLLEAWMSS